MSGVLVFDERDEATRLSVDLAADVLVFDEPMASVVEEISALEFLLFDAPPPELTVVEAPRDFLLIDEPAPAPTVQSAESDADILVITAGGPPGPTAYQLAVVNGFVGTEAQWLASLEGQVGPQGPAGNGTSYELVHGFASPQTLWAIDHNFGTYGLEVLCFDQNGDPLEVNVRYPTENRVEVDFYYPTAGTARLFR